MDDDERKLHRLRPLNMYGYSKHLSICMPARRLFQQIVGLKYFNVFGPNEDHKGDMRSSSTKASPRCAKGVIRLFKSYRTDYSDGEQKRDFLYVKDAVAMTLHLAATPRATACSNRLRPGADVAGLGQGRFCRLETQAQHRVHRNAGGHPRQIPVFHAGQSGPGCAPPVTPRPSTPLENAVSDYVRNYLVPDKRLDPAVE